MFKITWVVSMYYTGSSPQFWIWLAFLNVLVLSASLMSLLLVFWHPNVLVWMLLMRGNCKKYAYPAWGIKWKKRIIKIAWRINDIWNKRNVSMGHGCPRHDNRKLGSDRSENRLGRMGHHIKQPYQVSSHSLLRFLRKTWRKFVRTDRRTDGHE